MTDALVVIIQFTSDRTASHGNNDFITVQNQADVSKKSDSSMLSATTYQSVNLL